MHLPDFILGAAPAFLRVFLSLRVEVERYLSVDTDPEIVVHTTFLLVVLTAQRNRQLL